MSFVGALFVGAALSTVVNAAERQTFPDDWYFGGLERSPALKALEGKPAPGVSAAAWIGDEVTARDMRGKVVVIDFWATWCGPCVRSIPENVQLVQKHRDDPLVFIGIHDSNQGWDTASTVVSQKGINYPVALDASGPESSASRFKLSFFPTYVVIDGSGVVRAAGLLPNRVEDVVEALLAEAPPERAAFAAEFSPDHFYGGTSRPTSLRAVEGHAAPLLQGREWIGDARPSEGWASGATVLFVFSPSSAASANEFAKFEPVAKELANQGVTVVLVADAGAKRDVLAAFVEAKKVPYPVLIDGAVPSDAPAPVGDSTASPAAPVRGELSSALGAQFMPAIFIIDGKGLVRAAGVRTDRLKVVVERVRGDADLSAPRAVPEAQP